MAEAPTAPGTPRPLRLGGLMLTGAVGIALFFGGFLGWAALAPLESAAIAPGVVSVFTNRKTVAHLEGGIVDEIHIRDGDRVEAGQLLIRLDALQPRTVLEQLRARYRAASAIEARLVAERDGAEDIAFPDRLLDEAADLRVATILTSQRKIFDSRRRALEGQTGILEQRIKQLSQEIVGLKGQIAAERTQLELIAEEREAVETLVEKGLAQKPRLLALKRNEAEIEGSRSRNMALVARAGQQITEARLRISELTTAQVNEVVAELREVQGQLFELEERLSAAEDVVRRTEIRAPLAGSIVGLRVFTKGGVVGPGEPLLDIVPKGDRLIVEAQVDPQDIDVVRPQLLAYVRLTAFNQRNMSPLRGEVLTVSADRMLDERDGRAYFVAQVELVDDPTEQLPNAALYPGMQAEVMIVTGKRTALDYFFLPLRRGFERAFREDS